MVDTPVQKPDEPKDAPKVVVEQIVEQVQIPEREKKKLNVKMKAAKDRTKLTTTLALAEGFSQLNKLLKMGLDMFLDSFSSIGEFLGLKRDKEKGRVETKKQKVKREKASKDRRDRMIARVNVDKESLDKAEKLEKKMTNNPKWEQAFLASANHYGVCPAIPLAITWPESRCNPKARPRDPDTGELISSAQNLGQFLDGTWASFMKTEAAHWSLEPEVKWHAQPLDPCQIDAKKDRQNPLCGAISLSWYCKDNSTVNGVDIDPGNPEHAAICYASHFLGPGGAKDLLKWVETGEEGKVPGKPGGYYRKKFGDDYEAFAFYALGLANEVESISMALIRNKKWLGESGPDLLS